MAQKGNWPVGSSQVIRIVFLVVLAAALAGCSRSDPEAQTKAPPGAILLIGAGATFPSVLYNRWLVAYRESNPKIVIKYASVGSGEGVRRFIGMNIAEEEKIDFGASDAAMSNTEIATAQNNVLMIPATAGCVVMAYNLLRSRVTSSCRAEHTLEFFSATSKSGTIRSSRNQIRELRFPT